jgi:16S rRNA processing protein RimM
MSGIKPDGNAAPDVPADMVIMGRVSGLFGVRGWIKVFSHASPRDGIFDYSPWYLGEANDWRECQLLGGKTHGKGIVARIAGYDDRDRATQLIGCDIAVRRDQLPPLAQDEYYWSDLEGLRVRNLDDADLGVVSHLFHTGANDVMVVRNERERLIPYAWEQVVRRVDLEAGDILVDWDPEF